MILFQAMNPRATRDHLGLIPGFLSGENEARAKEQLDANYQHGGGWKPMRGFILNWDNSLSYPGDPPLPPLARARLRDETIIVYDYGFVAVIQPDRSFEVARMD